MNPAKCRGLLSSMLSTDQFVCLRLSDLSSVDEPYLLLSFIHLVRGQHTATEYGDCEMLAFTIYSLLTHTAQTSLFLSPSHLPVPSVKMHLVCWAKWEQRSTRSAPSAMGSCTDRPQNDLDRERSPFHVCLMAPDHQSLLFWWTAPIFCSCCNKETTLKKFEKKIISQNDYNDKFDGLLLHLHQYRSLCQPHLFLLFLCSSIIVLSSSVHNKAKEGENKSLRFLALSSRCKQFIVD